MENSDVKPWPGMPGITVTANDMNRALWALQCDPNVGRQPRPGSEVMLSAEALLLAGGLIAHIRTLDDWVERKSQVAVVVEEALGGFMDEWVQFRRSLDPSIEKRAAERRQRRNAGIAKAKATRESKRIGAAV